LEVIYAHWVIPTRAWSQATTCIWRDAKLHKNGAHENSPKGLWFSHQQYLLSCDC
jgi:hypothetical protein